MIHTPASCTRIRYTCYTGESLVFNDNKKVKLYLKIIRGYFFVLLKMNNTQVKKEVKMLKGFNVRNTKN